MAKLLWLDDWRNPEHYAPEFDGEIIWVKSYNEFDAWIQANGLPDMISFDYELGKGLNKFDDGIGCAKSIIRACTKDSMDEPLHFPVFAIHSDHPDVYDLQQYITLNIDLYDLGEVRQVGKIHVKPETPIPGAKPYHDFQTYEQRDKFIKEVAVPKAIASVYGKTLIVNPPKYKLNRNDKCGCGSGKKYKHCCIGK